MPELPEVEIVKKTLIKYLVNQKVSKVEILNKKLRYTIQNQLKKLVGKKILKIDRNAKFILIRFTDDLNLMTHFGMTGKYLVLDKYQILHRTSFFYQITQRLQKHDHLVITFQNKTILIYNDIRKFGFIKLIHSRNLLKDNHLVKIGPDPLSKKFNSNYCSDYLKAKNKNIKNMLLDQSFVGGIGNIYASEILFKSKIHPQRKCSTITPTEIKKIIYFSKSVLKKSIRLGGSSIKNYTNSEGQKGKFQREFNVYSREKERCVTKSCKHKISKIIIAGRSTFYCQNCQHK